MIAVIGPGTSRGSRGTRALLCVALAGALRDFLRLFPLALTKLGKTSEHSRKVLRLLPCRSDRPAFDKLFHHLATSCAARRCRQSERTRIMAMIAMIAVDSVINHSSEPSPP